MNARQLVVALLVGAATVGLALAAAYVSRFDTRTPIDGPNPSERFSQLETL